MTSETTPGAAPAAAPLGHVVPLLILAAVFWALLVLTALTVAVSQFDMGPINLYVALAIAGLKATLVVLYFMHLRYDQPFYLVVFLGCLGFVVLFISLVLTDTKASEKSMLPGQAPAMQDVHTPFGTPRP
jgi:cytochrome c oxidase subunit 4